MIASRPLRSALAVLLSVGLAACSSADPEEDKVETSSHMQPTGTPTPPVTPAPISSQWRTVKGPNFTVGVPASYEEEIVEASNGTKAYAFDAPRSGGGADTPGLQRLAILRDEDPTSDVVQQSFVLEEMKSVDAKADVTRSEMTWPGADKAVLIQWSDPVGGSDGARRETWQLMVQVTPKLILNVVALGPIETFEDSDLPKMLATFTAKE